MLSVLVAFMVAVTEHSNENRRRKLSSQFIMQSVVVGDSRQTEPEQPTVQREQYLHASAQLTLSTLVQFRIDTPPREWCHPLQVVLPISATTIKASCHGLPQGPCSQVILGLVKRNR